MSIFWILTILDLTLFKVFFVIHKDYIETLIIIYDINYSSKFFMFLYLKNSINISMRTDKP